MAKPNGPSKLDDVLRAELQSIADKQKVAIISFVAPHGVRTSPVTFASASIEEDEIYSLEEHVEQALKNGATALHFVIHTPGGEMHTSYKIASFLRSKFAHIKAFIPYEAASGGTILCCGADDLYIGDLGNLTSIDPQVRYKDTRVSAYAFVRASEYLKDEYGEMSPQEIPTPWQQMAGKMDPVVHDEMTTVLFTAASCARRLLMKAGYKPEKASGIAYRLTYNGYTHGMPIFATEAEQIGFNVKSDQKDVMKIYQKLVSVRLKEQSPRHVIDTVCPAPSTSPPKAPIASRVAKKAVTRTR
ncbi:hypothetical protein K8Q93_03700 [Candidatus Parcubacteria bacterium]|nr:hypothetical protein [Candidatus Parcubacteria bacterium]